MRVFVPPREELADTRGHDREVGENEYLRGWRGITVIFIAKRRDFTVRV